MSTPPLGQLERLWLDVMTDAFNRSLNTLEASGAIDLRKLKAAYSGVGSKYYDLVTQEMLSALRHQRAALEKLVSDDGGADA
jgi:hypothetical protein